MTPRLFKKLKFKVNFGYLSKVKMDKIETFIHLE